MEIQPVNKNIVPAAYARGLALIAALAAIFAGALIGHRMAEIQYQFL